MRLNLFLPVTQRSEEDPGGSVSASGHEKARRLFRPLGRTWAASPVRRLAQTVCFVSFVAMLFVMCWPYGSPKYAEHFAAKEVVPAEGFLALDPLVSLSTALAARAWVWSLGWAGAILVVCLVLPRGFCGYVCPLGTLIELCDWLVGRRVKRLRLEGRGWWVHLRYYVLAGTLVASLFGVLLAGFVAAIPVLTRGLLFLLQPLQIGLLKGSYLVPPLNAGHYVSTVLFLAVLSLGLLQPRFWCRSICPTGALFSVASLLRLSERKVASSCIGCGRCARVCPFDAIKADFTTRPLNCTFCQACGGVCPTGSIQFVGRWTPVDEKRWDGPPSREVDLSRRGFLVSGVGAAGAAVGIERLCGANLGSKSAILPVRPPGSVPEKEFLQLCIRCGECFQACPNNVLQPLGFEQGLEGIWTPQAVANWSGCEPSCNNCGQVCPTGAIRALPLAEKRVARMGLAVVNKQTCLPHAGREACQLCVDDCKAAGYDALEFVRVGTETDENGLPLEDTGFLAPVVLPEKCNGCGLCQMRCYRINAKEKGLLRDTAIRVEAGDGREDRLAKGSYVALREQEGRRRQAELGKRMREEGATDEYLPDFLK
jgi:ferredoxin